jgi:hypothetical protein
MDTFILKSLEEFTNMANMLLNHSIVSSYCYGSAVYDDFHIGYSDLDFFIIIDKMISKDDLQRLSSLRTELRNSNDPYLSVLEGEIISKNAIKNDIASNVIYWGTSSDRLNSKYDLSGFSLRGLIKSGLLIYGKDLRKELPYPSNEEMLAQVDNMIETIEKYAKVTNEHIHSADWLFLICQSIYWLKTSDITGKANAGKWVINNCDYSWISSVEKAILLRQSPILAESVENKDWLKNLGNVIKFACDDLREERNRYFSIIL